MINNQLFLLCACLLANFNAPETTATVRGMDGDDNASIVRHESGISGWELAKIIWEASPVFCAKLQLGLYLGAQELKTVEVVPDEAEIGRLCRGDELRVTVLHRANGYYNIEYGEVNFEIHTDGPAPTKLEDLSTCDLMQFEGMRAGNFPFNQDRFYLMHAVHDFAKANPGVESINDYLKVILWFTVQNSKFDSGPDIYAARRIFPEIGIHDSTETIRNKLIELLQTDSPHAQNMRQIIEDAGIRL